VPTRRFATACIVATACLYPLAWAGEDVDRSLAVDPEGMVEIFNPRGEIEVYGWDRAEVRVVGELDDLAERLRFEVHGNTTIIRVELPERNVNWGDGSELEIYLPATSMLKIDGVSAEVEVEGVAGAIAIRTITGDVEVQGIRSRTQINTVSGDVEVMEGTGSLTVVTTTGDCKAELDATSVSIDTMSGAVELELGAFDTLNLSSVSGTLEVEGRLNPAGRVSAQSVDGDIELRFGGPVNAQIRARTVAGGEIDNELTEDEPATLSSSQLLLETTSGDGSAEIHVSTVSGTIELEQADTDR
jgi:DUF4097 and DUF4098 domain-containing protein YvlB